MNRQTKGIGVGKAIEFLDMEFIGRPHNGADDAYNIGRIFEKIIETFVNFEKD